MKEHIRQGWRLAVKHLYIVIFLFLYQLLWGFGLYRYVESTFIPLLKRFPDTLPAERAVQVFLMEAQFQLMKTDLIQPYLWTLGALLLVRMLFSPLIQSGLLYSLRHATDEGGTKFFQGIRASWKKITLLYWIKSILVLAPAWWLLPAALQLLLNSPSLAEAAKIALPYAACWLLWSTLLHLLFLSLQFGAVSESGMLGSSLHSLRAFLPLLFITLIMWGIGAGIGLAASSVTLIWAGLLALILHQAFYLVQSLVRVWTLASQYELWESKQS
ncbi:hypothetical protein [Paenibacillus daejeonensis]|uniref:hypothetical protein n=1 Tax=Paenibacillus daejeonensis TaxID=135193 RepID=UPI00036A363B|nr:hypothetical protein [Paenibacillus daejeonensis]